MTRKKKNQRGRGWQNFVQYGNNMIGHNTHSNNVYSYFLIPNLLASDWLDAVVVLNAWCDCEKVYSETFTPSLLPGRMASHCTISFYPSFSPVFIFFLIDLEEIQLLPFQSNLIFSIISIE